MCTSPAVFIKLLSVSSAEFHSLEFISCGVQGHRIPAMYLYRINYFELTNCTFQQSRNTALYAFESTVILTGDNFINNSANHYGGAIFAVSSNVYLQGTNTFVYNNAQISGGAIAMASLSLFYTSRNTVFVGNEATAGGGIYMINSKVAFTGDSYFVENTAKYGSIITVDNSLLLFMANQSFSKNFAYFDGGIYVFNARMAMHGQNNFINNTSSGEGSAIGGIGCEMNITGNTSFIDNSANHSIVHACNSTMRVKGNNVFHNNTVLLNGVVEILNSTVIFEGCTTFTNNHAQHALSGIFIMSLFKLSHIPWKCFSSWEYSKRFSYTCH